MKETVESAVLEKFHRAQELSSILKKDSEEQTNQDVKRQAEEVLDEFDDIQKQRQNNLKKTKKQFKKQQQQIKQESEPTNKERKSEKALAYLKQWKKHRDDWKFKKILHIWLLKNWKDLDKFPDKRFKIFLKYLHAQNSHSHALLRIRQEAQQMIDDESIEESIRERSRSILQWLP
ncbi:hypothetical protein DERP_002023 [Dermatophagoides pteronyssinus]|uniref:WKF domain-containing protein n=1 Tax=Dermatophagoides pteronyssinus TaxID=6956 RepID=A0ABQ8JHD6_DERPT|nr:hypothetical protein DERP_002023 [Dermatophagoides pteronyssinus]